MAKTEKTTKKKYQYLTKAIIMPDGTRKYFRAKMQKELDETVLKAQILVNAGVDIGSEETFGHFAQMWFDMYKKPYLRERSLDAIKYVLNQHILPVIGGYHLRDITPMHIQAIMAGLSGKSNSLQSKVLSNLRNIFNHQLVQRSSSTGRRRLKKNLCPQWIAACYWIVSKIHEPEPFY